MNRKPIITSIKTYYLTFSEKMLFKKEKPWGIILFKRNIRSFKQVKSLTKEIRMIFNDPYFPIMIDEEGGSVSRLSDLINSKERNIPNGLKEVEELRELTEYTDYKGNGYIDKDYYCGEEIPEFIGFNKRLNNNKKMTPESKANKIIKVKKSLQRYEENYKDYNTIISKEGKELLKKISDDNVYIEDIKNFLKKLKNDEELNDEQEKYEKQKKQLDRYESIEKEILEIEEYNEKVDKNEEERKRESSYNYRVKENKISEDAMIKLYGQNILKNR